jgi:hypothetical protein
VIVEQILDVDCVCCRYCSCWRDLYNGDIDHAGETVYDGVIDLAGSIDLAGNIDHAGDIDQAGA